MGVERLRCGGVRCLPFSFGVQEGGRGRICLDAYLVVASRSARVCVEGGEEEGIVSPGAGHGTVAV